MFLKMDQPNKSEKKKQKINLMHLYISIVYSPLHQNKKLHFPRINFCSADNYQFQLIHNCIINFRTLLFKTIIKIV